MSAKEINPEGGPLANLRIRPSLKRQIDVESSGRGMSMADFAEMMWRHYIDNRADMVVQHPDGTIAIVEIKRPHQGFTSHERTTDGSTQGTPTNKTQRNSETPEHDLQRGQLHQSLDRILDSGIDVFTRGIIANIESWDLAAGVLRGEDLGITQAPGPLSPGVAETVAGVDRLIESPLETPEPSGEEKDGNTEGSAGGGKRGARRVQR